jgi:HD-GYP domain-containing protein (c-di-GMP phosphodiesterase class II)
MVRRAALLHDIGKLSVSNSILEKPGKLTEDEWTIMKQHPVYTRVILQNISGFEHLAFIAAAHHERLDGSGYPNGLLAEELPLTARIICVADVYQAITENRPYRNGMAPDEAFGIMDKQSKLFLDADCVGVLKKNHAPTAEEIEQARAVGI